MISLKRPILHYSDSNRQFMSCLPSHTVYPTINNPACVRQNVRSRYIIASWKGTKTVLRRCFQSRISGFPNVRHEHTAYKHRQRCRACWATYGCKRDTDHSTSNADRDAAWKSPSLSKNCTFAEPCRWCYHVHLMESRLCVKPSCRGTGVDVRQ